VNDRRLAALTLLVAGTFFMENLDGTILATAAPSIARSFRVDSASISIAITAYLLALAVFIPLSGWLTDRLGIRPVFLAAIAIFTVASGLCALSPNLPVFTALRVLQGIGGAMMVPVGRLAVLRATDKAGIIRAISWLTWPALFAPIVAPFLGGLITTYATWPWIFLLNLPLGVLAFVVALIVVPAGATARDRPLDWLGFVLIAAGLALLATAGSAFSEPDPLWPIAVIAAILGATITGLAALHLVRSERPLFGLDSFRIETFRITHAGGSLFRLTILAMPFLLALFFQDALGWSPLEAGAVILVLFVGNLAIKLFTTPLLRRFGFRPVLIVSTAGAAASMLLVALVSDSTPLVAIIALLFFGGVVRSVAFTAYNTIAFADVHEVDMTDANTLASTVQQVAAGFGVAVGAIALRAGEPLGRLLGGRSEVATFHAAFLLVGLLATVAMIEAITLSPRAGDNIRPVRVLG
jgi:EmrB/QacA subfamily drug resistance transporter